MEPLAPTSASTSTNCNKVHPSSSEHTNCTTMTSFFLIIFRAACESAITQSWNPLPIWRKLNFIQTQTSSVFATILEDLLKKAWKFARTWPFREQPLRQLSHGEHTFWLMQPKSPTRAANKSCGVQVNQNSFLQVKQLNTQALCGCTLTCKCNRMHVPSWS